MKKPKYKIGQWVIVKAEAVFGYFDNKDGNKRVMNRQPFPDGDKKCVVIGMTDKHTGFRETDTDYGDPFTGELDYTQTFLHVHDTYRVWHVRTGYMNKPFFALDEDVELLKNPPEEVPVKEVGWTIQTKKELSEISKDFDRDAKGRFI